MDEVRRRTIDNAKTEARGIRNRIAQFLTEYGATGEKILTWGEDQAISEAETKLAQFERRVIL